MTIASHLSPFEGRGLFIAGTVEEQGYHFLQNCLPTATFDPLSGNPLFEPGVRYKALALGTNLAGFASYLEQGKMMLIDDLWIPAWVQGHEDLRYLVQESLLYYLEDTARDHWCFEGLAVRIPCYVAEDADVRFLLVGQGLRPQGEDGEYNYHAKVLGKRIEPWLKT